MSIVQLNAVIIMAFVRWRKQAPNRHTRGQSSKQYCSLVSWRKFRRRGADRARRNHLCVPLLRVQNTAPNGNSAFYLVASCLYFCLLNGELTHLRALPTWKTAFASWHMQKMIRTGLAHVKITAKTGELRTPQLTAAFNEFGVAGWTLSSVKEDTV